MAYRKFAADQLFTGYALMEGAVLITDQRGVVVDIVPVDEAGEEVQVVDGLLCPGLINCHCHLELSHLRGLIPRETGMADFLITVMSIRNTPQQEILEAISRAEREMKEEGIVAVGDICNTAHTHGQKKQKNIFYHNFIEAAGVTDAASDSRFAHYRELYQLFAAISGSTYPGAECSLVPHAPYSVSDRLLAQINAHQPGSLLTIHNQESQAEKDFFGEGKGDLLRVYQALAIDPHTIPVPAKSSLVHVLEQISRHHSLVLVHNAYTGEDDLKWVQSAGEALPALYWCICAHANLYIGNRLPDIPLLKRYGARIVVGTDSLASNSRLSIIEELKLLQRNVPSLSLEELLRWATVNGAEALNIADRFGSFTPGKQPGLVQVSGVKDGRFSEEAHSSLLLPES